MYVPVQYWFSGQKFQNKIGKLSAPVVINFPHLEYF